MLVFHLHFLMNTVHAYSVSLHYITNVPLNPYRILMYAIAMADYDQDDDEVCKDFLKTKAAIDRLALYNSSVAR